MQYLMTTQIQYKLNLDKIINLLLKGALHKDIAKDMNLTERQIRNYAKAAKVYMAEELKGTSKEELIGQLSMSARMRMRQLWVMLKSTTSTKDKVAIINSLREEDRDIIKRGQITGLFPRTEEINNQINIVNAKISMEDAWVLFEKVYGQERKEIELTK